MFNLENFCPKLFNIKIIAGITIKPEKDVALVIEITSVNISVFFGRDTWKNIKKNKETKIVIKILEIKSLNELLIKLKDEKNSIGKKRMNKDVKNRTKLQKRLCPVQDVIGWLE